ncbi:MAG TPA: hypothetical protein VNI02_19505, partial [Blastocatellia bacterium]|nr:hypothetical protein [Blastocatellia bacterium]
MRNLGSPAHKQELLGRLRKVTPESGRRWGSMTPHQMVCHLNDSFKVAMGEKAASPIDNMFSRTMLKWVAIRVPLRWPKGYRTRPEIDQQIGGTRPVEFDRDVAELESLIERFAKRNRDFEWRAHP